jgi:hypothetical protein
MCLSCVIQIWFRSNDLSVIAFEKRVREQREREREGGEGGDIRIKIKLKKEEEEEKIQNGDQRRWETGIYLEFCPKEMARAHVSSSSSDYVQYRLVPGRVT